MTDYRQEVVVPDLRNLVLNPGGESDKLGTSYLASNGIVRTAVAPGGVVPAPVTGSSVIAYEVLDNTSLSYFFAPVGPNEAVHRGGFNIPAGRTVSFRLKLRATAACWVQVQASWMTERWVNGSSAGLSAPIEVSAAGPSVSVGTASWVDLLVFVPSTEVPVGATHWRPLISVYSSDPTTSPSAPPIGLTVFADSLLLPDSGVDLTGIPFGDGNTPGWAWEGEPNYSSSKTVSSAVPVLRNYVYDSSAADGALAPWAAYGVGTSATPVTEDSAPAIKVQRTAAGTTPSGIEATGSGFQAKQAGSIVTVSALVKVPTGATAHNITIEPGDTATGSTAVLGEPTSGALTTSVPASAEWTQIHVTGVVQNGVDLNRIRIMRTPVGSTSMPANEHFFVKNIMVSDGPLATFFDGNTADTVNFMYSWAGVPYQSVSVMYKATDLVEFGDELPSGDYDDFDDTTPIESRPDIPVDDEVIPDDPTLFRAQAEAPEVPDVAVASTRDRHFIIEKDVAQAEKVLGWRSANRHLQLAEDVQIGKLILNTVDEAGVVWIVSDIEGWWTTPTPDVPDVPRAWFDGSYETRGRYTARALTLTGAFVPRSPKDVAQARDRLIRAINLCYQGDWFMTHESNTDTGGDPLTKGAKVWLAGQPLINTTSQSGKTEFSVSLRAPDALKHSIKNAVPPGYNSSKMITTSSQYPERPYPRPYPWKYPDAVFGSTSVQLNNEGNASSWPIIRLAGPTNGAVRLFNDDTGQIMRITRKLYAGEVLEIDCFTRQVTLNGQGNFRFYLDIDVDWLMLQPGPNKLWFSEEVIGTIRTKLEVLWRSSWIG